MKGPNFQFNLQTI